MSNRLPFDGRGIGNWECQLPFEVLTWSDEVFDLFELPRGLRVNRDEILGFYTEESRAALEEARTRALRDGTGFQLDVTIVTALGKQRRMRIEAFVECENGVPVRLFGTKEDITENDPSAPRPPDASAGGGG